MNIFVGSTNPIKVNAVTIAIAEKFPDAKVTGIEVASGVSDQPRSDDETRKGAINRAHAAFDQAPLELKNSDKNSMIGVGLEGGVFEDQSGELWSTVWVCVVDSDGHTYESNGARFKVPEVIAQPIREGGEMGPVVDKIVGGSSVRQGSGAIGVITKNFIDRTEEYTIIAKMALGLWFGRNWQQELKTPTT
ncbi:MAG: inosine/xanthosine triphosphatase [Patescibacteria group bacterium]|nr:inosine/xanthosine triphosphatase [Patescibacteria group bacterium]